MFWVRVRVGFRFGLGLLLVVCLGLILELGFDLWLVLLIILGLEQQ
jgi:hypothetical protein